MLSYYFCWPEYGCPVFQWLLGESEFPASLPALLMMVCLAIAGAYQSSQGNSSENDPNNTTVSGLFFLKRRLGNSRYLIFHYFAIGLCGWVRFQCRWGVSKANFYSIWRNFLCEDSCRQALWICSIYQQVHINA